ncbi:hypothetical protein AB833_06620 [Chromatiales bacterium (ex Bugula neritina AB1)]|nr:hypothetical protein AB833_06620 [Chromatiales bacterium (ex Bugula neritina AB1)]
MIINNLKRAGALLIVLAALFAGNVYAVNVVRVMTVAEMDPASLITVYYSKPAAQAQVVEVHNRSAAPLTFNYRMGGIQNRVIQHSHRQILVIPRYVVPRYTRDEQESMVWINTISIAWPYRHLAGGWDVRALQRELERLGIKVKPKPPATPKPASRVSS